MILNAEITIYPSVATSTGTPATFADFLRLCIANKSRIEAARQAVGTPAYDEIKRQLPAATISGVFPTERKKEKMQKHSGYICIDIDHVTDCAMLIDRLADMENVAYVARSLSGSGVFAIIPIAYPNRHTQHYEALRRLFSDMGIEIDTQCKDVTRLRVVSYDPDARLRLDAVPFVGVWDEPRKPDRHEYTSRHYEDRTLEHVEECCRQIVAGHIDITCGYQNWCDVALSLASLGEIGRKFFHDVSSPNPDYKYSEADKQFNDCLNVHSKGIGTFFQMCENAGILYKRR